MEELGNNAKPKESQQLAGIMVKNALFLKVLEWFLCDFSSRTKLEMKFWRCDGCNLTIMQGRRLGIRYVFRFGSVNVII